MPKSFLVLLVIASLTPTSPARAAVGYFGLATCAGKIDKIPFTLDFFEEISDEAKGPTGNGYVVQTMGELTGLNLKSMGKITIEANADKSVQTINMFSLTDPSVLFARFPIDMTKKSEIEIYANNFGAVWGKFTCAPAPIR